MKKFKKNIFISSLSVTGITILIKFLGLLKQTIIASKCGATIETDAFYISTGVIGQLCIAIFSAISITLLTLYAEKKEEKDENEAIKLINSVLRLFLPIAIALSTLTFLLAPIISKLLAPSYNAYELSILTHYIKIVSFAFIPWCYYLIINVILESEKTFIPGRCQGLFQNLFLIIAAFLLFKKYGMIALTYAFLFSGIAESILITFCARKKLRIYFCKLSFKKELSKLLIVSLPLILGNAVYEINDIVDKQIATSIGTGFASILTYGATLNEMISGVIVSSVSIVLFSNFTTWIAKKDYYRVENCLKKALYILILFIIPITIIFTFSGSNIVKIFYGNGSLSSSELKNIYYVLIGYSVGFVFQTIRAVMIKVLYAFQDTKASMINGIISICTNILFSIILARIFGIIGVSLSTSIAMVIASFLLYRSVKKHLPKFSFKNMKKEFIAIILSGMISILTTIIIHQTHFYNNAFNYLFKLIFDCFIILFTYFIPMLILNERLLKKIKERIKMLA